MSPPGLHGFGMPPGQLMQMLRSLEPGQLQSLLDPFASFENDDGGPDSAARRSAQDYARNAPQAQSGQARESSAVQHGNAAPAAAFDGHNAADAFVNTLRELPGGVALLNALSHGSDAVPAGIARQLGEVAQQLTAMAQNPSAKTADNANQASALPGNAEAAGLRGQPAPAATGAQTANATNPANAASQANLASANAVPNTVANPGSNSAALPSAVPQAANAGQALPAGVRPEMPMPGMQQAANNVLAFPGNPAAVVTPQLAASVAAAQAQQAAQAAAQQAAQQALPLGNTVATSPQAVNANFINPHAAIPQGSSIGREGVLPLDRRNQLHLQRDAVVQGHTASAAGAQRHPRHVRLLPHRMRLWMAQMGLVKPESLWRDSAMNSEESHLQQWLYWLLAVVAYGGVGMLVLSLLPNGGGLLTETSRPVAGGLGLLAGVAAAFAAWWLRRRARGAVAPTP